MLRNENRFATHAVRPIEDFLVVMTNPIPTRMAWILDFIGEPLLILCN
jgi:hypothetical protein